MFMVVVGRKEMFALEVDWREGKHAHTKKLGLHQAASVGYSIPMDCVRSGGEW